MRYLTFVVVALLAGAAPVAAQDETLFRNAVTTGSFGGPVVKYTSLRDQGALMVGGRGGWIINHSLSIGGGGYGVVTEVNAPSEALPGEGPLDIEFGYGGLELEYTVHPHAIGHWSIYTLVGGGSANYVKDVGPVSKSHDQVSDSDTVFVVEPAIKAELNVTPWMRVTTGVSYRMVRGVNQVMLRNKDLSGIAGSLGFKFGKF